MKAWILSVCGIAFLGVMVDIITPEGKMNVFVKSVFSLFFIYVLVSPLIGVLNSKGAIQTNATWQMDDGLIGIVCEQKINELELAVVQALQNKGYGEYGVEITGNMDNNKIIIHKVEVFRPNNVLNSEDENINIQKNITSIIVDVLKVSEEVVVFE